MADWTIDQAEELYGVNRWGAGYFSIGENGNIKIAPNHRLPDITIDMREVVDEIIAEGIELPRSSISGRTARPQASPAAEGKRPRNSGNTSADVMG